MNLNAYITSAVYFYGIVHTKNLCDIVSHYTKTKVTRSQLQPYLNAIETTNPDLVRFDDFLFRKDLTKEYALQLYKENKKKPYYFPENNVFLSFHNLECILYHDAHKNFVHFLQTIAPSCKQDELLHQTIQLIQTGAGIQTIMQMFLQEGILLNSDQDIKTFSNLLVDVFQYTHIYKNHGYTPNDLANLLKHK